MTNSEGIGKKLTAENDVILGTAKGYGWHSIKNFAVSLAQSGFRGRKVMLVNTITGPAREALTKLGFELYDYTASAGNTVYERFRVIQEWCSKQTNVRFVIHCDVRDVVVQADPSPFMENDAHTIKIWGASEFITYRNEFCNPAWVKKLYGQPTLDTLLDEEVVCAGTIAAEFETFKKLIARIYESSTDRFGDDQAALNVLLRTEFKDVMRIPKWDEGFIATVGWWLVGRDNGNREQFVGKKSQLTATPPRIENGVIYPYNSQTPYAIIHQYDRGREFWPKVTTRYPTPFAVPNDAGEVRVAVKTVRRGPLKYSKDGLTIDWFDMHNIG